ncbi:MAG: 4-hydroxy-3-methylbut-2-enyl diphosphate reductase [Coriobacteriales bacterium]|jgi:4-hydroxy-3-methylbut-2-enyl diphosphate reductase|nr:4-hydroxy-3-methylbut-2-enyl diphosphate reductase [Coriobacteriales bacterium]
MVYSAHSGFTVPLDTAKVTSAQGKGLVATLMIDSSQQAPQIEVAAKAGACYGVQRALDLTDQALAEADGSKVYSLGPLIHNPQVIAELETRGVKVIDRLDAAGPGRLIVRTHGVPPDLALPPHTIDATCPYVKIAQRKTAELAASCDQVVIVGDDGHPEVEGLKGYAGDKGVVAADTKAARQIKQTGSVGIVVQTTQSQAALNEVAACFEAPRIANTICRATAERQQAAVELAQRADSMLVVGGRNSGNTKRLADLCAAVCPNTHLIEGASEIDPSWLVGSQLVGISAGASTPLAQIEEVRHALTD